MLQSCGTFTVRHCESANAACSAPGASPLKKRHPASNGTVTRCPRAGKLTSNSAAPNPAHPEQTTFILINHFFKGRVLIASEFGSPCAQFKIKNARRPAAKAWQRGFSLPAPPIEHGDHRQGVSLIVEHAATVPPRRNSRLPPEHSLATAVWRAQIDAVHLVD